MPDPAEPNLYELRRRDRPAFERMIEELRSAVRGRVEDAGLRQAAREVGMSATGLSNFVNGTEPYMRTIRKLRTWHAGRSGEPMDPP
ncbi:MAG TPA: hypothetical protein VEX86_12230 [Longimicrobium sp.]|nr:hypothetical protein [Longimicrobium sp.]